MKKIFLIPLLTLLCTVMAWGVTEVNVGTEAALREALANASGETRINLTANIRGTKAGNPANAELADNKKNGSFVVPSSANVILNLAEYSLTADAPEDGNADVPYFCTLYIKSGATVRIVTEGTGMVMSPCQADQAGFCIGNEGVLTINGGIFLGQTVGEEVGVELANPVLWNQSGSSAVINGGTFILADAPMGSWQGIIKAYGSTLTINGGRFSSKQVGNKNFMTGELNDVIDNHLGTGCSVESAAFSESYASWVHSVYIVTSAASSGVTYDVNGAEINEDVETTDVLVKAGVTVTLKNGHRITCDNLAFEDGTAQLIIEAGAAVIVNDEVTAPSVNNIHMTMDGRDNGDGNSYLLIKAGQIQESHPLATVTLKTKAYKKANGQYVFQRFAVPTYLTGFQRDSLIYDHDNAKTAIYRWDYATEKWKSMGDTEEFEPFQGYNMTTLASAAGQTYTFKARLVGNGNATLPLQGRWNCFANSYTAPIDIAPVIRYLYDGYQGDVSSSVYVHHAEGDYWDVVNVAQVLLNRMLQTTIEPMQAFVLERINPEASNPSIDYESHVYNPFMGIQPNNAPRRNAPAQLDFTFATMNVEAADGTRDIMEMYEGNQFDASFDNGFDVTKYMNENSFNVYFAAQEGNMAYLASDNLANTAITLETKEATSYTINFADVTMEGYVLRDNLTGTETEIVSGNTYSFSAPANSKIEGRFEIVAAKLPTAIEDVEVNANVKGIYTLTGQYMGENFHALPAGVYVINGKKVVK